VDTESGETRVFIPSRLEDSLALVRADPLYERRLMALGNPQLVKAWRYGDWEWSGCVADPAIFAEMGRESIYVEIRKAAAERRHSFVFTRANNDPNNDRVGGWQKMRDMLENAAADRPEKPGLWVFNTCVNFLRTVPTLQRDENKPDDVDTDQEDHAVDACRYACNSTERKLVEGRMRLG
jgi:hypothetical protein